MENPREQASESPATSLCRAGCGFYGSSAQDGLCSKCFKDALNKDSSAPTVPSSSRPTASEPPIPVPSAPALTSLDTPEGEATTAETASPSSLTAVPSDASLKTSESAPELPSASGGGSGASKKSGNRCGVCKKKVGLTGFECRCGGKFCGLHRYSDAHNCGFDYKSLGQAEVAKNNPLVAAKKIDKL